MTCKMIVPYHITGHSSEKLTPKYFFASFTIWLYFSIPAVSIKKCASPWVQSVRGVSKQSTLPMRPYARCRILRICSKTRAAALEEGEWTT